jgi:hypothetical protein
MNKSKNLLIFSGVDRYEERQILENVQLMKSCGFTNDACTEYLQDKGLFFSEEEVFNELPENEPNGSNPRDKDNAPSRVGKATGESNELQTESTTREDQLE